MITFKGSPLTLQGPPLRVGDTMPGFTLTDTALTEVRIPTFAVSGSS